MELMSIKMANGAKKLDEISREMYRVKKEVVYTRILRKAFI